MFKEALEDPIKDVGEVVANTETVQPAGKGLGHGLATEGHLLDESFGICRGFQKNSRPFQKSLSCPVFLAGFIRNRYL